MGKTTIVEFPIGGGLNEKVAQEYLDPTSGIARIVNGNFARMGAVDKRLGFESLPNARVPSGTGALPPSVRALSWSRSPLSFAGPGGLFAFSEAEQGVLEVGPLPSVDAIRRPIVTTPTAVAPSICDLPYGTTTLRVSLYLGTNYDVYATVSDAITQDVVLAPTLLYAATAAFPAVPTITQVMYLANAAPGTQLVVLFYDGNTENLYGCHYNPAANAFTIPTFLLTCGVADACPFANDPAGGFIIFYVSGATACRYVYSSPNFSPVGGGSIASLGASGFEMAYPLSVTGTYGSGEYVWFSYVTYNPSTSTYRMNVVALSFAFALILGPQIIETRPTTFLSSGIVRTSPDTALIAVLRGAGTGSPGANTVQGTTYSITSAGVVTRGSWPLGYLPVARPFMVGTTIYCACALALFLQTSAAPSSNHSEQGTIFLMQWFPEPANAQVSQWLPVATIAPRQVDLSFTVLSLLIEFGHIPLMSSQGTVGLGTRFACGLKTLGEDIAGISGAQGATWYVDFFFDAASQANLYQVAELGSELHVSAATPMVSDGATIFEDSFPYYPEFTYGTLSGTGNILTGTYGYAVVYVYPDAAGLLHRSAPVFVGPFTLSGGDGVTLTIPVLSATWRDVANPAQVYAEIYRTTSDGAIYYLVDRIQVSGQGDLFTGFATVVVWPETGVDEIPDSDVDVASILYTTGGVLDCVCPPSAAFLTTHRSRLVIVDETLRQTWESKAFEPGEAPGFNEALITPYPEGGDITGLASMDDKLVVFKSTSIWVRYGDGPADTGQGSDWTGPYRVTSDVGCIAWQSIVLTPMGIMFQSAAGIYLLGRDLQVSFVGKNVVGELASFPTIQGSVLVPEQNQVRFLAWNGESGFSSETQEIIVYDYLQSQWTTHVYGAVDGELVASMVRQLTTGQVALLGAAGDIWQEHLPTDPTPWLDEDATGATSWVASSVTWPWIKVQGVQAYQRVRRVMPLFEELDVFGVTMDLAFDYDPAPVETTSWTSAQLSPYAPTIQVEHHVSGAYNKRQAIQVTLTDTPGVPVDALLTGQGARFVNISLEIDAIGPRNRRIPAGLRT
jgi:hypothetical protein